MTENFWFYHSGLPGAASQVNDFLAPQRFLALNFPAALDATFQISLLTLKYAPSHVVTLRTEVDGWGRDIYGVFNDERWKFFLSKDNYHAGFSFKFILDGMHWMQGGDLTQGSLSNTEYDEGQVQFTSYAARFPHSYGNLRTNEDEPQQEIVHNNYSESENYEVIVIGSGMGGGVLADALTDRKVRTLVLDAGCLDFATHIYNLPGGDLGETVGRHAVQNLTKEANMKYFSDGVSMNLGGRSIFWSGVIPRMQDWELQAWPPPLRIYLGEKGRGYPDAEKLMRKHVTFGSLEEQLIQQMDPAFPGWKVEGTPMAQHQPEAAVSPNQPPQSFIEHPTGTFSTAELLIDSLSVKGQAGRDHLHLNLSHLVTRLEHQNDKVTGVVCQDLVGNRQRTYHGRYVVLAAGSTESPKIAWQSGLQDPNGKIGVGFTDHPAYFLGNNDHQPRLPVGSPWAGLDRHARIYLYPESATAGTGPSFNVEILINTDCWRVRHADDEVRQAELAGQAGQRTKINFKFPLASPLVDTNWVRPGHNGGKVRVNHPPLPQDQQLKAKVVAMCQQLLNFFQITDSAPHMMGYGCHGTVQHAGGTLRMDANGQGL